jgi:hypothetical protein
VEIHYEPGNFPISGIIFPPSCAWIQLYLFITGGERKPPLQRDPTNGVKLTPSRRWSEVINDVLSENGVPSISGEAMEEVCSRPFPRGKCDNSLQIFIYVMVNDDRLFDGNVAGHVDILTSYPVKGDPHKPHLLSFLPCCRFDAWSVFLDFCAAKGLPRQMSTWERFKSRSRDAVETPNHHSCNSDAGVMPLQKNTEAVMSVQARSGRSKGKRKRKARDTLSSCKHSEPTSESDFEIGMQRNHKRTRSEILV